MQHYIHDYHNLLMVLSYVRLKQRLYKFYAVKTVKYFEPWHGISYGQQHMPRGGGGGGLNAFNWYQIFAL